MDTKDKIKTLQNLLVTNNLAAYYIPTADFHNSEYVGDYFKARAYMSGFTGSAAVMVVTRDAAYLWTDGRYFIQAEKQLANSNITLMKMNEPNVLTVEEFLKANLKSGERFGFDGRVVMGRQKQLWETILKDLQVEFVSDLDLVDEIWTERPALPKEKVYALSIENVGESVASKLTRIREVMSKKQADFHFVASLDDFAWIFNLRGNDIAYSPVVLAYALISHSEATLFLDKSKFSEELVAQLASDHIQLQDYEAVYESLNKIDSQQSILLDDTKVNVAILQCLNCKVLRGNNPSTNFKAIKNTVELANTRNAHVKDGVAVSKFMIWLKEAIKHENLDEIKVADQLESYRRANEGFIELSFNTIAAYGENAASMHYSATPQQFAKLQPKGFLLVDSGATYYDGTTDITRTFALGELTDELKRDYTAVLQGMIQLSMAKFLYGNRGCNLDVLARMPIWQLDLDYKCGTGHGVGHVLNVHEGPNNIRWQSGTARVESCVLEEGMITTNEPGIYIQGSHGIRIENELITRKNVLNEYGQFMDFETITLAPIDLDPVLVDELTRAEKQFLNNYHAAVYEKIAPALSEEEQKALKYYTRAI